MSRVLAGDHLGLLLHEWTKLHHHRPAVEASPEEDWAEAALPGSGLQLPLALGDAAEEIAWRDAVARRRSVREYARRPLSLETLSLLLGRCSGPSGLEVSLVRLAPLVLQGEGLPPGAFLYDEHRRQLRGVRREDPRTMWEKSCFQREFTTAAAILLLIGSPARALRKHGDRGYRYLGIEAGILLQRIYLAAASLGLAGSVTGSLFQGKVDRWLGLDGYHASTLLGFALGHPAGEEADG